MLKLYLLRHAQADGGYDAADHERLLTKHGQKQAASMAKNLPAISTCLCSDAARTKMTLDAIEQAGGDISKTIYSSDLYNAPVEALLNAIQQCGDAKSVLLIAHNPGIHHLANMLAIENDDVMRERLMFDYAPATLSILECDIDNWKNIQANQNKLADLIIPD